MGTFRTFGLCWEVFEGVKVCVKVLHFLLSKFLKGWCYILLKEPCNYRQQEDETPWKLVMHPFYLFIFLVRRLHSKYCKALLSMSLFSKWLCNWLNNNFWKVFCCTQHTWLWQTVPIYDYCALQIVVFLCGLRFLSHKKINTAS